MNSRKLVYTFSLPGQLIVNMLWKVYVSEGNHMGGQCFEFVCD